MMDHVHSMCPGPSTIAATGYKTNEQGSTLYSVPSSIPHILKLRYMVLKLWSTIQNVRIPSGVVTVAELHQPFWDRERHQQRKS